MLEDEKDYSAFLAGDNDGFERLVIRYKDGLIYYLNKIIKNITIAEDLAQDAFVEVYVHKERFVPGKASFKTYLYTIGHHKAVDYVRKCQREVLTDFYEEEGTAMSGDHSPEVAIFFPFDTAKIIGFGFQDDPIQLTGGGIETAHFLHQFAEGAIVFPQPNPKLRRIFHKLYLGVIEGVHL